MYKRAGYKLLADEIVLDCNIISSKQQNTAKQLKTPTAPSSEEKMWRGFRTTRGVGRTSAVSQRGRGGPTTTPLEKLRKNSPFTSPVLAPQPSPSSTCVLQPRRHTALTNFSCRLDTSLFHMKLVLYVSPPLSAGSHPPPKTGYPTLLLLLPLPSPPTPLPCNPSPRHTKRSQMILNPFQSFTKINIHNHFNYYYSYIVQ